MWTFAAAVLLAAAVSAQQPNLGRCPEHVPMTDFNLKKFMGVWYEIERSFNLLESVGRCMLTNYSMVEGNKVIAQNHITNLLTGFTRITEGEVRSTGKLGEAKLSIRYFRLPVPVDFSYNILNTDYDEYAVLWNCLPVGGPFLNTQNVWIMSRKRNPEAKVLQKAYGVLDNYKITRTGFTKIDQQECTKEPIREEEEDEEPGAASKSAYPEPSKEMEPPKAQQPQPESPVPPESESLLPENPTQKPVTIPALPPQLPSEGPPKDMASEPAVKKS